MSLVVRIIAPTGRDAELIVDVLRRHGIASEQGILSALFAEGSEQRLLGPLLIAEEALDRAFRLRLSAFVQSQSAWSDLPILILTRSGRDTATIQESESERLALGSPVLLERPIRTATLVSSVRAALRARSRQYEIRDAVAALKQERETLQVLLDNLPVGVLLAKPSGEIVLGNRRIEEIFRHPVLPSRDIEDHGDWVAYHADGTRVKGSEYPLIRAMQAGHPLPPEDYLYERGDGTKAWVRLAASPILNDLGAVAGGVVAVSDIDQQKRSEMALIQNEKLAAVGRLAASISHEINNPLEAVTNLIYLARQSTELSEELRSFLDLADQELGRVSQIVTDTLRFHRQSTKPRAITAEDLLGPTLGLYSGRLSNASINLVVDHRSGCLVTCYEGEIRQVLSNLIGNAIESMRKGGRLLIRTRDGRFWQDGAPCVRITIADTGHGIPPEIAQRIFEAFYTTKGINGTGLGLWISRGIIEKHRGSLQLRSSTRPGKSGTAFSLSLRCESS